MNQITKNDEIRQKVREQYSQVVNSQTSCCSASSCCCDSSNSNTVYSGLGYSQNEINEAPPSSNLGLGCGNPQLIANLREGEIVLDLGCGAGFDCFLAAKKVSQNGIVIGIDMTPDMISQARKNAEKSNTTNVEFRLGEIENIPVKDNYVDIIISNCVINLSPDKQRVFDEAYRVLKINGRLAISDIVAEQEIPEEIKNDMKAYSGCISGASTVIEIKKMLDAAGFREVKINVNKSSKDFIKNWMPGIEKYIVSASIEAIK